MAALQQIVNEEVARASLANAAAGAYEKYTLDVGERLADSQALAAATALSKIEDAEYARESSDAIRGQILAEVSLRMLGVANQIEAEKISLLAGAGFTAVA